MSETFENIEVIYTEYNGETKCLHFVFEVNNTDIDDGDFWEFTCLDSEQQPVSNSWVEAANFKPLSTEFNATIIMIKNTHHLDYGLSHYSADAELKRILPLKTFLTAIPETTAGIIGVNESKDGSELELLFWSGDMNTKCQFGKTLSNAEYRSVTQDKYVGKAKSSLPLNRENLTLIPVIGNGQRFSNLKPFNSINFPSSIGLSHLKNIHEGESAWIVGNGPSVRTEDLNLLQDSITFCFNRFYLAHDDTVLRATYTISGDEQMINDFGQEIVDCNPGKVFLANSTAPDVNGDYFWLRQVSVFPSLFSFEPEYYVTPGGSSLYVAMQLAYYMGIKNLFIYGADFSFTFKRNLGEKDAFRKASGDGNHFIKNYRSGKNWCPPSHRNIANSFYAARKLFEYNGGGVFNATRGGILEIFERVSFEDALVKGEKK